MATNQGSSGVSNFCLFKSCLEAYAIKVGLRNTKYEFYKEGPLHKPFIRSTVILNGIRYDSLPGFFSRKAAQESAAEVAVKELAKSSEVKECFSQLVHETGLCKTILKEYALKMNYALPMYECQKVVIPGHDRVTHFSCTVEIGGMRYIGPAARKQKEAEIKAARTALLAIQSSSSELSGLLGVLGDSSQLTIIPGKKTPSATGDVKSNVVAAINTSGLVGLPVSQTVCPENTGIPGCNRSGLVELQITPTPSVSAGMLQVASDVQLGTETMMNSKEVSKSNLIPSGGESSATNTEPIMKPKEDNDACQLGQSVVSDIVSAENTGIPGCNRSGLVGLQVTPTPSVSAGMLQVASDVQLGTETKLNSKEVSKSNVNPSGGESSAANTEPMVKPKEDNGASKLGQSVVSDIVYAENTGIPGCYRSGLVGLQVTPTPSVSAGMLQVASDVQLGTETKLNSKEVSKSNVNPSGGESSAANTEPMVKPKEDNAASQLGQSVASDIVFAENTGIPGCNRSGLVKIEVVKTPSALKPKRSRWKKKKMGKQSPTRDVKSNIAAAINTSGLVGLPVSQTVCAENTGIPGCSGLDGLKVTPTTSVSAGKLQVASDVQLGTETMMNSKEVSKSNVNPSRGESSAWNTKPMMKPKEDNGATQLGQSVVSDIVSAENTGIPGCNKSGLVEIEVVKTPSARKPKRSMWRKKKMGKQSPTGDVKSNIAAMVGLPVSQIVCAENTGIPGCNRSGLVGLQVTPTPSVSAGMLQVASDVQLGTETMINSKEVLKANVNPSGGESSAANTEPIMRPKEDNGASQLGQSVASDIVSAENTGIPGCDSSRLVEIEVVKTPSALKPMGSGCKKKKKKKKMVKQSPTGDVKKNIVSAINTSGLVGLPVSRTVCSENTGIPGCNRSGPVKIEVVKTPSALKPKRSKWKKKKMGKQSRTGDMKNNIAAPINTSGLVGSPVSRTVCPENTGIPGCNRSGPVKIEVVKTPSALKPKRSKWKKKMGKQSRTGDVKNNIAAPINTSGLLGSPVSRTVCAENTGISGFNRSSLVGLQVTPTPSDLARMLQVAMQHHLFRRGCCK